MSTKRDESDEMGLAQFCDKTFFASTWCTNWHHLALRLVLALQEVGASPQEESHNAMLSAHLLEDPTFMETYAVAKGKLRRW